MAMSIRISIAALLMTTVEACFLASPFCRVEGEMSRRISGRPARRVPYYDEYSGDDEFNYNTREFENPSFRTVGDSPVERELRSIPYEDEGMDPSSSSSSLQIPRKRPQMQRYDNQDPDDDYYREKERLNVDGEEAETGNFWSNPNGRADTLSPRPGRPSRPEGTRPRRRPLDEGPSRSTRRKSRSTFRSGTPEPPVAISDFYNRLFWYGVDPEETTSPADRTMFGGTKGKFNGLSYINQVKDAKYSGPESDYWGDEDYANSDKLEQQEGKLAPRWKSVTPPYDAPAPRTRNGEQEPDEWRKRDPRRPSTADSSDDYKYDDSDVGFRDDWASQRVSRWFEGEDDDDFVPRRKTRRRDASWSAFDFLDSFLGLDRRKLEKQATQYDERMGIGGKRHRRPRPNDQLQRNEYSYRAFNEDNESLQLDADYDVIDTQAISSDAESKEEQETGRRELTWEERAAAIERVPPADVPAFGATGDLGVDARTKAITDALEDIADARRKVEEREKNDRRLREEMTVLRVDAELEKKRLRKSQMTTKMIQEKLRRIDRQIEDAARGLRYSQMKLKEARDDLSDVETRHWAVLRFYNPGLAEKGVEEALRELEETEPAVRRYAAKASSDEAKSPLSRPEAPVETAQENRTAD